MPLPPDSSDAESLLPPLLEILKGLSSCGVRVVSYSTDGAAVERSIQKSLALSCKESLSYSFKHPAASHPDIVIKIPLFEGLPLIMMQDSKHLLKTGRNNMFTGSRCLLLGAFYAAYHMLEDMIVAKEQGGPSPPIMDRDVRKLDRQDDRAASRLFSSSMLDFTRNHHPHQLGLFYYLFVFGELVDACQSRCLSFIKRIVKAYRAWAFFELWRSFLKASNRPESLYFISRECYDITQTLVMGIISLILVYRDFGETIGSTLALWLHSTEPAEHTIAEIRKCCPDATFLDILYLASKLRRLMRSSNNHHASTANKTASGYFHTYLMDHGINIEELGRFPSNSDIEEAIKLGYREACAIWVALGYDASVKLAHPLSQATNLPPVSGMTNFEAMDNKATLLLSNDLSQEDGTSSTCESASDPDELIEEDLDDRNLPHLIALEAAKSCKVAKELEDEISDLRSCDCIGDRQMGAVFAAIGLEFDRHMKIQSLPSDDSSLNKEDSQWIDRFASYKLPPLANPEPHLHPSFQIDISPLRAVKLRQISETRHASEAVRRRKTPVLSEDALRHRTTTIELHRILRDSNTGELKPRIKRWTSSAPKTGNSANAEAVKVDQEQKLLTRRAEAYNALSISISTLAGSASVTLSNKLQPLSFVVMSIEKRLFVGQIMTLYTKGPGKNSPHAYIPGLSSVTGVSNAVAQVLGFYGETDDGAYLFTPTPLILSAHQRHLTQYSLIRGPNIVAVVGKLETTSGPYGETYLMARGQVRKNIAVLFQNEGAIVGVVDVLLKRGAAIK